MKTLDLGPISTPKGNERVLWSPESGLVRYIADVPYWVDDAGEVQYGILGSGDRAALQGIGNVASKIGGGMSKTLNTATAFADRTAAPTLGGTIKNIASEAAPPAVKAAQSAADALARGAKNVVGRAVSKPVASQPQQAAPAAQPIPTAQPAPASPPLNWQQKSQSMRAGTFQPTPAAVPAGAQPTAQVVPQVPQAVSQKIQEHLAANPWSHGHELASAFKDYGLPPGQTMESVLQDMVNRGILEHRQSRPFFRATKPSSMYALAKKPQQPFQAPPGNDMLLGETGDTIRHNTTQYDTIDYVAYATDLLRQGNANPLHPGAPSGGGDGLIAPKAEQPQVPSLPKVPMPQPPQLSQPKLAPANMSPIKSANNAVKDSQQGNQLSKQEKPEKIEPGRLREHIQGGGDIGEILHSGQFPWHKATVNDMTAYINAAKQLGPSEFWTMASGANQALAGAKGQHVEHAGEMLRHAAHVMPPGPEVGLDNENAGHAVMLALPPGREDEVKGILNSLPKVAGHHNAYFLPEGFDLQRFLGRELPVRQFKMAGPQQSTGQSAPLEVNGPNEPATPPGKQQGPLPEAWDTGNRLQGGADERARQAAVDQRAAQQQQMGLPPNAADKAVEDLMASAANQPTAKQPAHPEVKYEPRYGIESFGTSYEPATGMPPIDATPAKPESLAGQPVIHLQHLGTGSDSTLHKGVSTAFRATLGNGRQVVWKPDIGGEKLSKQEVGAYRIAQIMGVDDLVPPTVELKSGKATGSAMAWNHGATNAAKLTGNAKFDGPRDLARAAVLDYLLGNMDRHSNNWQIGKDGKLRLIDHGYSLPEEEEMYGEVQQLAEKAVRDGLGMEAIQPMEDKWQEIKSALEQAGVSRPRIVGVKKRFDNLVWAQKNGIQKIADLPAYYPGYNTFGEQMGHRKK